MENPRKRYVQQFKKYPDVVSVLTFREMLGGIGDSFARKLIRDGLVKAIFIKPHYWIFKESIIDYVLSEDYAERRLKVRVPDYSGCPCFALGTISAGRETPEN